jgi:CMP-N,N'-diacetyllegionaminic acid synthase
MKKCVVILARGGSKSIPRKNLIKINGKPLISYPIEAAFHAGYKNVWVSTEDKEIGKLSKSYGAKIHNRPVELAGDLSTDVDCFVDFVSQHREYDYIIHLRATSPQINSTIIEEAVKLFETNYEKVDSLRSITKVSNSPFKTWFLDSEGLLEPVVKGGHNFHSLPRQILRPAYYQNACIDIIKTSTIIDKKCMVGDKCIPYHMDVDYNIDIDTNDDLLQAKTKLENL